MATSSSSNTSVAGDRAQLNIVHNPVPDAGNNNTFAISQILHRRNAISLTRPAPATIDPQILALGPDPRGYLEAERQADLVLDLAAIEAADREFYGAPRRRRLDIESIIGSAERRTVRRRRAGGRIGVRSAWAEGESDDDDDIDEEDVGGVRGMAELTFEGRLALETDGVLRDVRNEEVIVTEDVMEEVMRRWVRDGRRKMRRVM
ncbi:hypothetical protein B0A48_01090 [Cryoendolithus antarcticus]|uniref:Uncharacterized protein n=1 Tax=Cryoendolithus antarcticus TaxID=1507870 RepID=A0A1V8TSB8_9PEZI|nr:hypothetical protein B0A48_01090 [Cryoendolithus antarcticus]